MHGMLLLGAVEACLPGNFQLKVRFNEIESGSNFKNDIYNTAIKTLQKAIFLTVAHV